MDSQNSLMMITHNLGYPRIGNNREIKKAIEGYWSGKINYNQLIQTSAEIKQKNWLLQKDLGIDLISSNDFSFYDQVLDMTFIGPGVYDIHSPRVPSINEMVDLLKKASVVIPKENIWVNPDCGLKTREWGETNKAIIEMVNAARMVRETI